MNAVSSFGIVVTSERNVFLGSVGPRVNSLKCKWDLHRKVQNQQNKKYNKDVGWHSKSM